MQKCFCYNNSVNALLYLGLLGEVMITQVNGLEAYRVPKDPRRKSQSIQFRNHSQIPYKSNYDEEFARQQKNAFWTSISIVAGSVLFTVVYFLLSGMKNVK